MGENRSGTSPRGCRRQDFREQGMIRDKGIEDIYDGHFYGPEDLVPVGCSDCRGCSACCRNTGDSIILDPYDMFLLSKGTGKTFTEMVEREIEIRQVDGLILPNLMQHHENEGAVQEEALSGDHCPFLSAAGRCAIHPYRPGMCRLYPMGRYYTESGFHYILQKDECADRRKTPVLLRDWLGYDDLPRYEAYIQDWHDFKKQAESAMYRLTDKSRRSVGLYILKIFFVHPYLTDRDFYPQYGVRMDVCRQELAQILPPGPAE